jgi:CHAT domain-containing protein/tetratricopeptide (TPR) repeat protein
MWACERARGVLVRALRLSLFALAPLSADTAKSVAADSAVVSRPKTFEFRDDFQTDTRRNFHTTGEVEWSKGQFTLKTGVSLAKPLEAGPQVDCEMSLSFPSGKSTGLLSETQVVFEVEDTVAEVASLQTAAGVSMAARIRVKRVGEALRGTIEITEYPWKDLLLRTSTYSGVHFKIPPLQRAFELPLTSQPARWRFHYDQGLLTVSCEAKQLAAWWRENFSAGVTSIRVSQSQGALGCRALTIRGKVRAPAVSPLQVVRLLAAAARDSEATRLRYAGRHREALSRYKQSYDTLLERFGPEHFYTMAAVHNMAGEYSAIGDYVRAEQLYRQNVEMDQKLHGDQHPNLARGMENLASIYLATSDDARAEPLLRQALKIRQNVFGDEDPETAQALGSLADLYEHMEDYARAEPLYLKALGIERKVFGNKGYETGSALRDLADAYVAQGKYALAEPIYREALEIVRDAKGVKHPTYAAILGQFGLLQDYRGNVIEAERLYKQSLELRKESLGADNPRCTASLNQLGLHYLRVGDEATAETPLRQSLEIMEKQFARTSSVLSERQQLQWSLAVRYLLDGYLSLGGSAKVTDRAKYSHCLRWKGAVFVAQTQIRVLRQNPELLPAFDELQSVSGQLATLAYRIPDANQSDAWKKRIAELTDRKESIERTLAEKSADFREQRAQIELKPDRLRLSLPRGSVLVDFLEYTRYRAPPERRGPMKRKRHLVAFIVRPDREIQSVELGPIDALRKNINAWRTDYGSSAAGVDAANALKRAIWEPIEPHLDGCETVLVSPDGDLARFPMGALPGKALDSYLIEERNLVVISVPRLLPERLANGRRTRQQRTAVFVGDVDFDNDPTRSPSQEQPKTLVAAGTHRSAVRFGNVDFPPLPGSASEIEEIAALFSQHFGVGHHKLLCANKATEDALRTEAPRCTYLHLATHGFFQPVDDRRPQAEAEVWQFGSFHDREQAVGFHPGLQCGLALAGANRKSAAAEAAGKSMDDGILTAIEVASLDLRNVELVVLSACDTGLGKTASGEGVLGLQRAFQMAGARNVVASLWKVDDRATVALMRVFYHKLWVEQKPAAIALREAQLDLLRHPEQIESLATTRGPNFEKTVKLVDHGQRTPTTKTTSPRVWAAFVVSGTGM